MVAATIGGTTPQENQTFVRVAGHYHIIKQKPGALVLDANSGYETELFHFTKWMSKESGLLQQDQTL